MSVGTTRRPELATAGDDGRLRKDFGSIGLLFTAVGSIIGSGWLFGALEGAEIAGPSAIFSWIIGTVMFVLIGLTYAEVGVMFPHSGGIARFPHYAFGTFTSFTMGWITWLATVSVAPIEVEAVTQYATTYLPWLQIENNGTPVLTGPGLAVSVGLMALFTLINFLGVRWFARINNVLVWWKLAVIALVVVVFFAVSFHGSNFSSAGFAPGGTAGIFEAIPSAAIAFAFFGFRQGIELAGETSNPRRNIPLTLVGSVLICGLIYILLQVAFIGAVPGGALRAAGGWENIGTHLQAGVDASKKASFGPLAVTASVLGVSWLAVLLYIDAIVSPSDTGLIYNGATARLSYGMARNRNAPAALGRVNTTGVPWVGLLLSFVIGCVFFLPFPGWQSLVQFVTNTTVLSFGMGPLVLLALRKQIPEFPRAFRLRGAWVIASLALLSSNLIIFWSGWDTNWKMFAAIVIGFILLGGQQWLSSEPAPLDFRHGWWLLVWFAGLTMLSYLGPYPKVSKGAGNLGLLPTGWGALASVVLTAIVLALAYICRLPAEQVRQQVQAQGQPDDHSAT